jgi:hypothetical protein
MSNANRIWIELPKGEFEEMKQTAKKANNFLSKVYPKLGVEFGVIENRGYILISLDNSGYLELQDNGHWFSLEGF